MNKKIKEIVRACNRLRCISYSRPDKIWISEKTIKRLIGNEWTPIKKRKPKKQGLYLVFMKSADTEKPFVFLSWYNLKTFEFINPVLIKHISHWCNIPDYSNI